MRLITLAFLILLATAGIGLGGGIPIPLHKRKENTVEVAEENTGSTQQKPK